MGDFTWVLMAYTYDSSNDELKRLMQEDCKFEATQVCRARICLKNKQTKKQSTTQLQKEK
jgi:hypothetical protein